MKHVIFAVTAALLFAQFSFARPVTATVGVRHYGPVTKEISDSIRAAAVVSLRKDIHIWLKENINVELDTLNTVKSYSLGKLTERSLLSAEEKTFNKGRTWNVSLTAGENEMKEALNAHNGYYGVLLKQNWDRYGEIAQSDPDAALASSIRALCAASLQIGVKNSEPSIDTLLKTVQNLFNKVQVKSDIMVIEGKPGAHPVKFPTAKFTIDGAPLTGLHVTAFIQNGRELSRMTTFIDGTLALDNHVIPFVQNGSMLSLVPDARSYMDDAPDFIKFRDLGVRFNRGQELSFIYKVPTLNAALNFKARSPDNSIEVPREFSSDAHVRKFLKDSCNIQTVPPDKKPDLTIDISVEFIGRQYPEIGDESVLMTGKAAFKSGWFNKNGQTVFEKRREMGTGIEMGPYFLEASTALRALVKKAMYD